MKIRIVILCATLYTLALTVKAQERMHSTMFGGGWADVYDTYLSPYKYKGGEMRIIRETYRPTKILDGHIKVQTLANFDAGYLENRGGEAHEWFGGFRYSFNWLYGTSTSICNNQLQLMAGTGVSGYLGGIYNTRNGNNPAQGKADVMINLTGKIDYAFNVWNKQYHVNYQFIIPLVGVAFSPNFGQSYYEAFSLGNYDHNVVFAWLGNKPSMQHSLIVSFPVAKNIVCVGYYGEFLQSTWNNLRYHQYSNDILIGWKKYFTL